jgi:SAM-dependent methyltransferase
MSPTGFTDSLTPVARFIEWLQPERVLDVGVGGGRMGFLAREYAHLPWHPHAKVGPVVVDGIEGYAPYVGDLQRALYDELLVGEAIETLTTMAEAGRRYDLVIAADILEHFSSQDAPHFLDGCLRVGQCVLIVTPRRYFDQQSSDNPLETHRSHWPEDSLLRLGATAVLHRGESSTVCLFGDETVARTYSTGLRAARWYRWILPPEWERLLKDLRARARPRPHRS